MFKRFIVLLSEEWARWWLRYAGISRLGRMAIRIATVAPLPYGTYYENNAGFTRLSTFGYVAPTVIIAHRNLQLGPRIFIRDHVSIVADLEGGPIDMGERVWIQNGCRLQTHRNGSIRIDHETYIGCYCEIMAALTAIRIGARVLVSSYCCFYSYDHGIAPGTRILDQCVTTKGDIVIEDDAWIGTRTIVLSGVRIGAGAVVGAGSVVTRDVPPGCIAAGNPARILRHRDTSTASNIP